MAGRHGRNSQEMVRRIVVQRSVRREIDEVTGSYEQIRKGLGAKFYGEVLEILSMIEMYLEMYAEIRPRIRRAVVRGYPYNLFYVVGMRRVSVLALFHQAEDPDKWPSI